MSNPASNDPRFTVDWSQHYFENVRKYLWHLADTPVNYLETGVYEGRSGVWLLENFLTHPRSLYTGIDCWERCPQFAGTRRGRAHRPRGAKSSNHMGMAKAKMRAIYNFRRFGDKATLYNGLAPKVLGRLEQLSYDVIYIDDDHTKHAVLESTIAAWPLLKVGGIMVWDDYNVEDPPYPGVSLGVAEALADKKYSVLFDNKQYAVVKKAEYGLKELPAD